MGPTHTRDISAPSSPLLFICPLPPASQDPDPDPDLDLTSAQLIDTLTSCSNEVRTFPSSAELPSRAALEAWVVRTTYFQSEVWTGVWTEWIYSKKVPTRGLYVQSRQ